MAWFAAAAPLYTSLSPCDRVTPCKLLLLLECCRMFGGLKPGATHMHCRRVVIGGDHCDGVPALILGTQGAQRHCSGSG